MMKHILLLTAMAALFGATSAFSQQEEADKEMTKFATDFLKVVKSGKLQKLENFFMTEKLTRELVAQSTMELTEERLVETIGQMRKALEKTKETVKLAPRSYGFAWEQVELISVTHTGVKERDKVSKTDIHLSCSVGKGRLRIKLDDALVTSAGWRCADDVKIWPETEEETMSMEEGMEEATYEETMEEATYELEEIAYGEEARFGNEEELRSQLDEFMLSVLGSYRNNELATYEKHYGTNEDMIAIVDQMIGDDGSVEAQQIKATLEKEIEQTMNKKVTEGLSLWNKNQEAFKDASIDPKQATFYWNSAMLSKQMGSPVADVETHITLGEGWGTASFNCIYTGQKWLLNFPQPFLLRGKDSECELYEQEKRYHGKL